MKNFVIAAAIISAVASAEASEGELIVEGELWDPSQQACVTSVDDRLYELVVSPEHEEILENSSFREILFSGWGAITCPGEMTLWAMIPDKSPEERGNYCLVYSKERRTYLGYARKEKDKYWRCVDYVDFEKVDISPRASFVFTKDQTAINQNVFRCNAVIDENGYRLTYDFDDDELLDNLSFRDALFGGDCPGQAVLGALIPELSAVERSVFCLVYDSEKDQYVGYAEGPRDAYMVCKEPSVPMCDRVNATKEEALAVVGLGAGASFGASAATSAASVTAVTHSSGAVILTGSSGYIAGTLGTVGTGLVGVLTAPATLTAAAVSIVAVGGAMYVCQPADGESE